MWRRTASQLLKVGVSALALALVAYEVDWVEMRRVLATAAPSELVVVFLLYLAGQALTALRWRMIALRIGFSQSLAEFTRYYYIGMFFNLFGPATLGGDVVRSLYLGAAAKRRAAALNTVVFDRVSGLATLVMVAVCALALFGRFGLPWPVVATTAAAGVALTAGWWIVPVAARRMLSPRSRLVRLIDEELGPFWKDRGLIAATAWVSVGFHVLQIGSLILLGNSISMQADWRYYFVFHPLVTVLSAAPVSLAGLGIRELGYVWFLELQGVPRDTAFAFGLLWFGVLTAASLVGGLVYLRSGQAIPPLRSARTKPAEVERENEAAG